MIAVNNVTLAYGKRVLFDEVNLKFTKGNCFGVIGANGAGKSTFLKILSGEIDPNKGTVRDYPRGHSLAVLKQNHFEFDQFTVLDTVLKGYTRLWEIMRERETIYAKADFSEEDGLRAGEIEGEFGEMGGYTAESDAGTLLEEVGVPVSWHSVLMKDLPGNLKLRVLLAQALYGNPDILLLDEPTNDLDVTTIGWLENFLADYENIVIVVSHDRHFLDAVCTHTADVDRQKIRIYTGNYSFWYESSQLAARQLGDRNTEKPREKPCRRTHGLHRPLQRQCLQVQAGDLPEESPGKAGHRRHPAPSSRKYPGIIFKPDREVGNQIPECTRPHAKPSEGFAGVTFSVQKNDKIAFLSKNHRALTSFFNVINGEAKADTGTLEWGTTITKAYLPNDNSKYFQNDLNLMDWLRQFVPPHVTDVDEDFLRGFFGKMLFTGDEVRKKTSVLSGGEKVRCMISRMMLQNPNCVILDEPTNHLDLESITSFNDSMTDVKGIVLFTTHDHQFMQTVANRIIGSTPRGIIEPVDDVRRVPSRIAAWLRSGEEACTREAFSVIRHRLVLPPFQTRHAPSDVPVCHVRWGQYIAGHMYLLGQFQIHPPRRLL